MAIRKLFRHSIIICAIFFLILTPITAFTCVSSTGYGHAIIYEVPDLKGNQSVIDKIEYPSWTHKPPAEVLFVEIEPRWWANNTIKISILFNSEYQKLLNNKSYKTISSISGSHGVHSFKVLHKDFIKDDLVFLVMIDKDKASNYSINKTVYFRLNAAVNFHDSFQPWLFLSDNGFGFLFIWLIDIPTYSCCWVQLFPLIMGISLLIVSYMKKKKRAKAKKVITPDLR